MLTSGDWVTARLDGVIYLEKPPLIYWLIAISYKIFGVHDWAARIPMALSAIALCWLTAAIGVWAFGKRAGFYAGLCMSTCIGLWLFTRVLIPDVMLTFTIALAMWALLRVLDDDEPHPRVWAYALAASLGVGLLLKSLIGVVFPVAAGLIYLAITRQLFSARTWKRLHPFTGTLIILFIAVPWHVLATLRNPPYFDFTMRSVPGEYHGFLWFFFINEQLLRFLNLRYPRDYNTVPRLYFWLFHLVWLFPWSVYFPAAAKLSYKPADRAGKTRLLALCWIGFILIFFTFSTTQEYYSMPCYPAMALLLGSAIAAGGEWISARHPRLDRNHRIAPLSQPSPSSLRCATSRRLGISLPHSARTRGPTPSRWATWKTLRCSRSRTFGFRSPSLHSPSALECSEPFEREARQAFLAAALMMVLFFHAARLAMVDFDPFLSSRSIAEVLNRSPQGDADRRPSLLLVFFGVFLHRTVRLCS